jgi:hypothetical protein
MPSTRRTGRKQPQTRVTLAVPLADMATRARPPVRQVSRLLPLDLDGGLANVGLRKHGFVSVKGRGTASCEAAVRSGISQARSRKSVSYDRPRP